MPETDEKPLVVQSVEVSARGTFVRIARDGVPLIRAACTLSEHPGGGR